MNVIIEIIISIMIIIGGLLSILAAIGVIRLPDVYTRTHAAGISNTFGVSLLLFATVGYFFHSGEGFNARVLLAVLFIFLTTPVASHLINRAAYDTGVPLAIRIRDQLRSVKKTISRKRKVLLSDKNKLKKHDKNGKNWKNEWNGNDAKKKLMSAKIRKNKNVNARNKRLKNSRMILSMKSSSKMKVKPNQTMINRKNKKSMARFNLCHAYYFRFFLTAMVHLLIQSNFSVSSVIFISQTWVLLPIWIASAVAVTNPACFDAK